jgi:hypothetical protein
VTAGNWHLPWSEVSHPAPRLSIVVLPFANLGGDPEQQYFADGITEDVTTWLGLPRCNRCFGEPDSQAAALAQGDVIGGPIRHPVPLLRDVMATILVRF